MDIDESECLTFTMLTVVKEQSEIAKWLPVTKSEAEKLGWDQPDVILISGDAYIDHPAFGAAVIGRVIEKEGYRVAIIPQPNWRDDLRDFKIFGAPRYFFGVTSGCMDSMVSHYTVNKRLRSTDAYSQGGKAGLRPDYAVATYTRIVKSLYPDTPVIIGGIEASLRRVTHYDYWSDKLMPSILETSGADLLVYGMGEMPLREILKLLKKGVPFHQLTMVKQTTYLRNQSDGIPKNKHWKDIHIHSHQKCLEEKKAFAANFKKIEQESNKVTANRIVQDIGDKTLIINPPFPTMTEEKIDASFDLPYTRLPHPKYKTLGAIPAYEMIKFSITMHRGCFGGCSFCTISAHQGKFIASRSQASLMREVEQVTSMPDFKGYISDLGGPSANMYKMKGRIQEICDKCARPSCIYPAVCDNLNTNHSQITEIYRKVDAHPKVKKAFVGSGIRHDLLTKNYNKKADGSIYDYMTQLITRHVSGRLKVAPEHTSPVILKIMRKPSFEHFKEFKRMFDRIDKQYGLNQQLVPYFISSHPGCKDEDMATLAAETRELGFHLEQVQDFTPTPMTVATVMYYSGYHPYTLKECYVPKSIREKKEQHRFFFWYRKENQDWIRKKLFELKKPDVLKKLFPYGKTKSHPQAETFGGKMSHRPQR
ncbi:MAG: YgiQ family radical SAM protein [Candidatus Brocadiaceae bacterium]|nr:YgiQ family radical SAM protein [Candidatus Brocadiaceae bacterium]